MMTSLCLLPPLPCHFSFLSSDQLRPIIKLCIIRYEHRAIYTKPRNLSPPPALLLPLYATPPAFQHSDEKRRVVGDIDAPFPRRQVSLPQRAEQIIEGNCVTSEEPTSKKTGSLYFGLPFHVIHNISAFWIIRGRGEGRKGKGKQDDQLATYTRHINKRVYRTHTQANKQYEILKTCRPSSPPPCVYVCNRW